MSGGAGEEERTTMKSRSAEFPQQVVFSAPGGGVWIGVAARWKLLCGGIDFGGASYALFCGGMDPGEPAKLFCGGIDPDGT